jgi:hypothetical protein
VVIALFARNGILGIVDSLLRRRKVKVDEPKGGST